MQLWENNAKINLKYVWMHGLDSASGDAVYEFGKEVFLPNWERNSWTCELLGEETAALYV
jgi:hypothetical protein